MYCGSQCSKNLSVLHGVLLYNKKIRAESELCDYIENLAHIKLNAGREAQTDTVYELSVASDKKTLG